MITGKDLQEWGLQPGPVFKTALRLLVPNPKGFSKTDIEVSFKALLKDPEVAIKGKIPWAAEIARMIVAEGSKKTAKTTLVMNTNICPITIYGDPMIEQEARSQIYTAAKLPVAVKAALMPDAHAGYGLPIGGVLATRGAVIPWAVGVDIGCRMQMTVMDIPGRLARGMEAKLCNTLDENTVFGAGKELGIKVEHSILEDERFDLPLIRKLNLKFQASKQLGTSGGGNHFVEFGSVELEGVDEPKLAVLSHSGSRGIGYKIATAYSDLAMDICKLPGDAKHLAWLDMASDIGKEYWEAMNLAGEFAKACHDIIHHRIVRALGAGVVKLFENHHNFAWKEVVDGQDVIVHRKGATPAGTGVTGLIPGSMTTPTYVVRGKGNLDSVCSSSHGAGRAMSRTEAKQKYTLSQMKADLLQAGVTLLGGSVDECSMAYKDIESVMTAQKDLVEVIGKFKPFIVKMAEGEEKPWQKE